MICTRTTRDHYQSIQRQAPQKVNTIERHGYLDISSCPETNCMLQVANLKVENKILKSVIAKHFMFCSTWRKNKPAARFARKPRLTYLYINTALQRTPTKPTNDITRYITNVIFRTVRQLSREHFSEYYVLFNVDKLLYVLIRSAQTKHKTFINI